MAQDISSQSILVVTDAASEALARKADRRGLILRNLDVVTLYYRFLSPTDEAVATTANANELRAGEQLTMDGGDSCPAGAISIIAAAAGPYSAYAAQW